MDCLVIDRLAAFPAGLAAGQRQALADGRYPTYQLLIRLPAAAAVEVGKLGRFHFAAGCYRYTGSARRGMAARLARHLRRRKRCHWHIDYFLLGTAAVVEEIRLYRLPECQVNRQTAGLIVAPGFGAGDCRRGCGSHLKLTAPLAGG
ncbi:MAG: DUF123 domain-containing protein [Deltaproteobacteria bacterium]|nr:DUF123 domain-containing protein [Deltaproteobacteria bacterium]